VKLGDDVGDGVTDARDFTQSIFCDDLLEGLVRASRFSSCTAIRLRAIGFATAQGGALAEFVKQLGNRGRVERHS
jgi:hypothetical protein